MELGALYKRWRRWSYILPSVLAKNKLQYHLMLVDLVIISLQRLRGLMQGQHENDPPRGLVRYYRESLKTDRE